MVAFVKDYWRRFGLLAVISIGVWLIWLGRHDFPAAVTERLPLLGWLSVIWAIYREAGWRIHRPFMRAEFQRQLHAQIEDANGEIRAWQRDLENAVADRNKLQAELNSRAASDKERAAARLLFNDDKRRLEAELQEARALIEQARRQGGALLPQNVGGADETVAGDLARYLK
jgi:septal ring factor EnvC (AmiA/AmiB activator)